MEYSDVKPIWIKYILVHIWKYISPNVYINYNYLFGDSYFYYIHKVNYIKIKIFMNWILAKYNIILTNKRNNKNRCDNFQFLVIIKSKKIL